MVNRLALIGFGEAGATFAKAAGWGAGVRAFDIDPLRTTAMAETGLYEAHSPAEALTDASLILSLVTADQALTAAKDCAALLKPGAIWCDMNSIAPETKRRAGEIVEAAGGRYVDVAVLAPVHAARMAVPLLLSGPCSDNAAQALSAIGFSNVRTVGETIGRASTIKMIRSVMVKGIEALTDEMMAAAEVADVVDDVVESLDFSERNAPWSQRVAYNLERMLTHGSRRAAEMEESAKTLTALGIEPVMTSGTIRRQREAARRGNTDRGTA